MGRIGLGSGAISPTYNPALALGGVRVQAHVTESSSLRTEPTSRALNALQWEAELQRAVRLRNFLVLDVDALPVHRVSPPSAPCGRPSSAPLSAHSVMRRYGVHIYLYQVKTRPRLPAQIGDELGQTMRG